MKDLRFTGYIDGQYVDVTFRTDMINDTDGSCNITQIMEGRDFSTYDKQNPDGAYLKYFSATFKETNVMLGDLKNFAIDNNLDLRMISQDGTVTYLVEDESLSVSA